MKSFITTATLALLGLTSASPVPSSSSSAASSVPIHLQISSGNHTLNGKYISTCHAGAAIESLCIGDQPTQFKLNTTANAASPVKGYSPPGTLAYELVIADNGRVPEPMSLAFDPTTNVAEAIFMPEYTSQSVVFGSSNGEMGIVSYLKKGQVTPVGGYAQVLKNWYVCNTFYGGYNVQSLTWVVGEGAPFNPTCQKVSVRKLKA